MKLVSLEDLLETFLAEPTRSGFLRVRQQLIAADDYAPHASVLDDIAELLERRQAEAALAAIDELLPAWGLSPRVHFLAGQAAEMLGDEEEVELCRFLTATCLQGILLSGRGTRRSPFVSTYPSDVADVLAAKGLTAVSQHLTEAALLRVATQTGRTVWFDVGDMLVATAARSQLANVE